jgi:hypothetical protein
MTQPPIFTMSALILAGVAVVAAGICVIAYSDGLR